MQEVKLFSVFTERFNKLNVPYIVTGSVASIVYGEPRITHDIDIVINLPEKFLDKLYELFPSDEFYLPPKEIIVNEILRDSRGHCNILHHETGFKADVYFCGKNDFQYWALENAKPIKIFNEIIPLAPVEYVIIKKLEFYKEGKSQKHINDIKAILKNSRNLINFKLLNKFIEHYGLSNEWKLCE